MSPILVVGALLGQMKLPKPLAEKAASLFGLSEAEKRMLNEVPMRGAPMPPTDPLLSRLYELVMVNGPALKPIHDWVRTFERTWTSRLDQLDDLLVELQHQPEKDR